MRWYPFATIFLLLSSLQLSAQEYLESTILFKEKITLDLEDCLRVIQDQTDIQFSYSPSLIDTKQEVFISNGQCTLDEFLNEILPFYNISYLLKKNQKILLYIDPNRIEFSYNFFGKVIDSRTSEPLSNVLVLAGEYVSYTDDNGYFSFRFSRLPEKINSLFFSLLGYQDKNYLVDPRTNILEVAMDHSNRLDTIVIRPIPKVFPDDIIGGKLHDLENIEHSTGITGSNDIIGASRQIASVDSGGEGSHGLYVRGGSADQNLILVDGISVYEFSHVGGINSIFLPDLVQNASFSAGGFSAEHGGKLSSVIEINLKEGNKNVHERKVGLGIDGVNIGIEGPIITGKSSYLFSGRISTLDLITKPLINRILSFDNSTLGYYDGYGKLTHNFSPTQKISLTAYSGNDVIQFQDQDDFYRVDTLLVEKNFNEINWGNTLVGLNYNSIVGKFNISAFLNFSQYNFNTRSSFERSVSTDTLLNNFAFDVLTLSLNRDYLSKVRVKYYSDRLGELVFGAEFNRQSFSPIINRDTLYLSLDPLAVSKIQSKLRSNNAAGFLELRKHLIPTMYLKAGLRFVRNFGDDFGYNLFEPRFSLSYLGDNIRIELMSSIMHQNVHLLLNPGVGLPSDLWYPSSATLEPEQALEFSLSTKLKLSKYQSVTLNLFNKNYSNLLDYRNPTDFFFSIINNEPIVVAEVIDLEKEVVVGSGNSQGVELSFQTDTEKLNWWINYKYAISNRQFDEIDNGQPFPYKYDRRHDLNAGISYQISPSRKLALNWVYGSGYRFSIADDVSFINGQFIETASQRNNAILPPFHHLDIKYQWFKELPSGKIDAHIGVYNLYNRKNPFYAYISDSDEADQENLRIISIFPIIPNFNVNYRW